MEPSEILEDSSQCSTTSEPTEKPSKKTGKRKCEENTADPFKKANCILKGMKCFELHSILANDPIAFCQETGLFPESVTCFCCNEKMRLETGTGASKQQMRWVCRKKGVIKGRSIKIGTWFENSRSSLADILWMNYMWLHKYSTGLMIHETDHTPKVIIGWNKKCVEACQFIMESKNDPIGGEGIIVEIFDCEFQGGHPLNWGFCALELKSTKALYVVVADETSSTITTMLSTYMLPGTTLFGLFWGRYKNLTKKDFIFLTKEKKISFYQPTTKTEMNTYDEFVNGVNRPQPLMHLIKYKNDSKFFEKMYRSSLSNASDAFIAFLEDLSTVYKPSEVFSAAEMVKKEKVDIVEVTKEKKIKKKKKSHVNSENELNT